MSLQDIKLTKDQAASLIDSIISHYYSLATKDIAADQTLQLLKKRRNVLIEALTGYQFPEELVSIVQKQFNTLNISQDEKINDYGSKLLNYIAGTLLAQNLNYILKIDANNFQKNVKGKLDNKVAALSNFSSSILPAFFRQIKEIDSISPPYDSNQIQAINSITPQQILKQFDTPNDIKSELTKLLSEMSIPNNISPFNDGYFINKSTLIEQQDFIKLYKTLIAARIYANYETTNAEEIKNAYDESLAWANKLCGTLFEAWKNNRSIIIPNTAEQLTTFEQELLTKSIITDSDQTIAPEVSKLILQSLPQITVPPFNQAAFEKIFNVIETNYPEIQNIAQESRLEFSRFYLGTILGYLLNDKLNNNEPLTAENFAERYDRAKAWAENKPQEILSFWLLNAYFIKTKVSSSGRLIYKDSEVITKLINTPLTKYEQFVYFENNVNADYLANRYESIKAVGQFKLSVEQREEAEIFFRDKLPELPIFVTRSPQYSLGAAKLNDFIHNLTTNNVAVFYQFGNPTKLSGTLDLPTYNYSNDDKDIDFINYMGAVLPEDIAGQLTVTTSPFHFEDQLAKPGSYELENFWVTTKKVNSINKDTDNPLQSNIDIYELTIEFKKENRQPYKVIVCNTKTPDMYSLNFTDEQLIIMLKYGQLADAHQQNIGIACRGGHGRTGEMAYLLAKFLADVNKEDIKSKSPEEMIKWLRTARPGLIQTHDQYLDAQRLSARMLELKTQIINKVLHLPPPVDENIHLNKLLSDIAKTDTLSNEIVNQTFEYIIKNPNALSLFLRKRDNNHLSPELQIVRKKLINNETFITKLLNNEHTRNLIITNHILAQDLLNTNSSSIIAKLKEYGLTQDTLPEMAVSVLSNKYSIFKDNISVELLINSLLLSDDHKIVPYIALPQYINIAIRSSEPIMRAIIAKANKKELEQLLIKYPEDVLTCLLNHPKLAEAKYGNSFPQQLIDTIIKNQNFKFSSENTTNKILNIVYEHASPEQLRKLIIKYPETMKPWVLADSLIAKDAFELSKSASEQDKKEYAEAVKIFYPDINTFADIHSRFLKMKEKDFVEAYPSAIPSQVLSFPKRTTDELQLMTVGKAIIENTDIINKKRVQIQENRKSGAKEKIIMGAIASLTGIGALIGIPLIISGIIDYRKAKQDPFENLSIPIPETTANVSRRLALNRKDVRRELANALKEEVNPENTRPNITLESPKLGSTPPNMDEKAIQEPNKRLDDQFRSTCSIRS